jgi:protein gp37
MSIESSGYARRADDLRQVPAAVRFLSCEPLLGPLRTLDLTGIGWVIVGGESGPGHRPMDIGWLESIVGQCRDAGVPVWTKQDSGPRAGQRGRIPGELWVHEFPGGAA